MTLTAYFEPSSRSAPPLELQCAGVDCMLVSELDTAPEVLGEPRPGAAAGGPVGPGPLIHRVDAVQLELLQQRAAAGLEGTKYQGGM
jgi:hypothetical protein